MYNQPSPVAVGGGIIGAGGGTIAYTGFSTLSVGMVAAALIVGGLVLMRMAYLARSGRDDAVSAA